MFQGHWSQRTVVAFFRCVEEGRGEGGRPYPANSHGTSLKGQFRSESSYFMTRPLKGSRTLLGEEIARAKAWRPEMTEDVGQEAGDKVGRAVLGVT